MEATQSPGQDAVPHRRNEKPEDEVSPPGTSFVSAALTSVSPDDTQGRSEVLILDVEEFEPLERQIDIPSDATSVPEIGTTSPIPRDDHPFEQNDTLLDIPSDDHLYEQDEGAIAICSTGNSDERADPLTEDTDVMIDRDESLLPGENERYIIRIQHYMRDRRVFHNTLQLIQVIGLIYMMYDSFHGLMVVSVPGFIELYNRRASILTVCQLVGPPAVRMIRACRDVLSAIQQLLKQIWEYIFSNDKQK